MKFFSTCGGYSVDIYHYGSDANSRYQAVAYIEDGNTYGGASYWFNIGIYKTEKNAIRAAVKAMAKYGKELCLETVTA